MRAGTPEGTGRPPRCPSHARGQEGALPSGPSILQRLVDVRSPNTQSRLVPVMVCAVSGDGFLADHYILNAKDVFRV